MYVKIDTPFKSIFGSNLYILVAYLKFQLLKCFGNVKKNPNNLSSVSIIVDKPQGHDCFLLLWEIWMNTCYFLSLCSGLFHCLVGTNPKSYFLCSGYAFMYLQSFADNPAMLIQGKLLQTTYIWPVVLAWSHITSFPNSQSSHKLS